MSLAEVMMGVAIVGVMIYASMTATNAAHQMTTLNNDKEFATQKAISILEEMKALVQSDTGTDITILDKYDDGIGTSNILTIQNTKLAANSTKTPTQPDDPISGNKSMGPGRWLYERRISVQLVQGNANDVRLVNVKVFKNTPTGLRLLAEVSSVIRTLVTNMPPSQVYDVYAIAVENVPGWWVYMSNVLPFVKNSINDLQSRNPGLVFRTHWINTLSYGRDREYMPVVNNTNDSTADINSVYFYPGTMPTNGCCGDNYYYPPFNFRGRINLDGVSPVTAPGGSDGDVNGYVAQDLSATPPIQGNAMPYALADMWNNSMRYVDELATYNARKTLDPNEEMTLRLLLDDMYMSPWKYTNALVINLHGELIPFPPVRNYSDAAKDPEQISSPDRRNIRVVTHPEQLRYLNTDAVKLRVYSYLFDPDAAGAPGILSGPITIVIRNTAGWMPVTGDIKGIHGGVDNDGNGSPDPYDTAPVNIPTCPASPATQMCYTATTFGTDTVIKLINSPLKAPLDTSTGRGLDYASRLYDMEYIPSPVEDLTTGGTPFSRDLTWATPLPKNTARWTIQIPSNKLASDNYTQIETRIGDQTPTSGPGGGMTGTLWPTRNHPANLSTTYFWRGTDTTIFGDATTTPPTPAILPMSERYQYLGDPRHCPYSDLKRPNKFATATFPSGTGVYENKLGMGYNRYFDDFEDSTFDATDQAEIIGTVAVPGAGLAFTSSNNKVAVKIDGGSTITVTIGTGTLTLTSIVNTLNANASFNTKAVAYNFNGHLRIVSKTNTIGTTSVQFDTSTGTAQTILGFDNLVRPAGLWIGWKYTAGGNQYGVKNNGTAGDDGWSSGGSDYIEADVHRFFEMVRTALIKTNAIWTTMTGWSYYYMGLGNEIGYDSANNFNNSVPVSTKPYTGASGSQYIDSITSNSGGSLIGPQGVYTIKDQTGSWWAMPWLGELYPDTMYDAGTGIDWKDYGNLPTGTGANKFVRVLRDQFPGFPGTAWTKTVRRTNQYGSVTMVWGGTASSTFHHNGGSSPDTGTIQTAGTDIANNYSFPVPTTINSNRPFDVNVNNTGGNPESFLLPGAYPAANTIAVLNQYYKHNTGIQSSALITVKDTNTKDVAFVSVNGLSPTGISGTTFIAKWSFLTLIQSYLNGGLYTDAAASPSNLKHVRQLPRLSITSPNINTNMKNPSSLSVAYSIVWHRWDDIAYTTAYSASYSETLTMKYAVLYSPTNGTPAPKATPPNPTGWFYMQDDTVAYPGVKPDAAHELTALTYTWNTPASKFSEGNYLIRVEGYREGYPLHYCFHQYRAYIKR